MFNDKISENDFFLEVDKNLKKIASQEKTDQQTYKNKGLICLKAAAFLMKNSNFKEEADIIFKVCLNKTKNLELYYPPEDEVII